MNDLPSAEAYVIEKIKERVKIGKAKYGVTTDRQDLDFNDWLIHLEEELMDSLIYIQKLKKENERHI